MRRFALLAAVIAATAVSMAAAPARAATTKLEIVEADVSGHPDVRVTLTAPAALLGVDLAEDAFTVLEDGEVVDVEVERVAVDDLEVVLVVDTSGSMQGEPMAAARRAATTFLRGLPAGTPVAVIGFGARPTVALPFSEDVDAQVRAIESLVAAGETALYDALVAAANEHTKETDTARRSVVVLSDGGDTTSSATIDRAISTLRDIDARVSIVELVSPESDHTSLERLATETRGRLVAAGDTSALDAAYRAVTADLIGRYELSFRTAHHGTVPVAIELRAANVLASTATTLTYPAASAAAPSPAAPTTHRAEDPGLLGSDRLLAGGAIALFLALAIAVAMAMAPDQRRIRLRDDAMVAGNSRSGITSLAQRATAAADRTLERRGRRRTLDAVLEQAGLALRAGEVVLLVTVAAAVAFVIGLGLGGLLVALALAGITVYGARAGILQLRARRRQRFADQLDDLLQLLAGSMRAGYGLLQAIETAGNEAESPAADELRRLGTEVRLGRDLADSLDAMAGRLDNEDFEWVAQAIRIHREVGGDLAEVLDRVSETIRDRNHLKRQVRALSAEGRISAGVLFALPIGFALIMSLINPDYVGDLFTTGPGQIMLVVAVSLLVAGGTWLRRIIRPVY